MVPRVQSAPCLGLSGSLLLFSCTLIRQRDAWDPRKRQGDRGGNRKSAGRIGLEPRLYSPPGGVGGGVFHAQLERALASSSPGLPPSQPQQQSEGTNLGQGSKGGKSFPLSGPWFYIYPSKYFQVLG
jgi:hypothetical protein